MLFIDNVYQIGVDCSYDRSKALLKESGLILFNPPQILTISLFLLGLFSPLWVLSTLYLQTL